MESLSERDAAYVDALAAHAQFSRLANRTVDALRKSPESAGVTYIEADGTEKVIRLVRGVWVQSMKHVRLMLIDEKKECKMCKECIPGCRTNVKSYTRVLCEIDKPTIIPAHTHSHDEFITVIDGSLKDDIIESGCEMRRCHDKIFYKAGVMHSPELYGMILICWTPPLNQLNII